MTAVSSARRVVGALANIGVSPSDDDSIRGQKVALTLAASLITLLSFVWVGTYWALALPTAAAIPLAYQVASVASLALFARTKGYRAFRLSQAMMMTSLPFLLQWALGGYVASSAVSLWALVAAIGTLFFFTAVASIPWFIAFVALSVLSGLLEPLISTNPSPIPESLRTWFFVLNIGGVSVTAYVLLQYAIRARDAALGRSDRLLLNVLPRSIAQRLKHEPGVIADAHDEVTVVFADVVGFTPFTERTEPRRVVGVLDEVFSAFDALTVRFGLEKIKTIGDAYMVAAGLPEPRADHAQAAADMALEMQAAVAALSRRLDLELQIRIGMESGSAIAGVIGRHRFIYDLWGDTVNKASRLESHGLPGRIQAGEGAHLLLCDRYTFEDRGEIDVKGRGRLHAYLLMGRVPKGDESAVRASSRATP